jgi:hypothetical protein
MANKSNHFGHLNLELRIYLGSGLPAGRQELGIWNFKRYELYD